MKKKKVINLGIHQPILTKEPKQESIHEICKRYGIPSKDTTNEHIGQTTLIFRKSVEKQVENDSLECSIKNLKFSRFSK